MKTVIIVSKCSGVITLNSSEIWYKFHFKGVCAGEALSRILLKGKADMAIIKGEEYLMYVQLISCSQGVLKGTILKLKPLHECWDRS